MNDSDFLKRLALLVGIATLSVAFTQQAVAQDADADEYDEIEEVVKTLRFFECPVESEKNFRSKID